MFEEEGIYFLPRCFVVGVTPRGFNKPYVFRDTVEIIHLFNIIMQFTDRFNGIEAITVGLGNQQMPWSYQCPNILEICLLSIYRHHAVTMAVNGPCIYMSLQCTCTAYRGCGFNAGFPVFTGESL